MKRKLNQFDKEKQKLFEKLQRLLFQRVRSSQTSLLLKLGDLIDQILIDEDGNLKFTATNLKKINNISLTIERHQNLSFRQIGIWIGQKVSELLNLNIRYNKSVLGLAAETTDAKVQRLIMQRLGFDSTEGKLIKGGWLDNLTTRTGIGERIGADVNRAISSKMGLSDFKKQFRNAFTSNKNGLGLVEAHFNTKAFDIFQETDRLTAKTYADEYKLNYALYAGTVKDTTRPFCKERVQQVFSREEIEKWKNINFKGKPSGFYDPATQCGGYNCRHHLSWMSDELAKELRPDLK